MQYSHFFTLHCKGAQEDIDSFMQALKGKWPSDSQDWTEPGDKPNSLKFYRIDFLRHYDYTKDLLPYMKAFTAETGHPLSFFFALERLDNSSNEAFCGYSVYDGNSPVSEHRTGWLSERKQHLLEGLFEEMVKPALQKWLNGDPLDDDYEDDYDEDESDDEDDDEDDDDTAWLTDDDDYEKR